MGLLELLILILVIAWIGGFALHIGGGMIHLLLLILAIVVIVRVLQGRSV